MSDCMCNPKSNAICTQALSCICPEPYSGLTCYECMNGYFLQHSQCIQLVQTPVQFQQSSEDNEAENAPAKQLSVKKGLKIMKTLVNFKPITTNLHLKIL